MPKIGVCSEVSCSSRSVTRRFGGCSLAVLRVRSREFKDLEIGVLRHDLAILRRRSRHMALSLTPDECLELERRVRSRKIRAEDARRANVILMLAQGESYTTIAARLGCYPAYVTRWKQRFEAERVAGLQAEYRGQPARVRTPAMEARILAKTRQRPSDGSTHWGRHRPSEAVP